MTASTPFAIAETTPQDSDVASAFPATERTYRDTVETWLLAISTVYGYTRVPALTTTQRNTETNWAVGNMIYNTTLARLQAVTSIGPVVWADALGPNDNFPSGTRMLFQQTAAPTGWVKEASATYNDAAVRFTTGSIATGGSTAFSSVFTSRTIAQANLPNVNFTITGSAADHTHFLFANENAGVPGVGLNLDSSTQVTSNAVGGASDVQYALENTATAATVGKSSAAGTLALTGTAASGGSGTALDFAVKYADVIIAQKS